MRDVPSESSLRRTRVGLSRKEAAHSKQKRKGDFLKRLGKVQRSLGDDRRMRMYEPCDKGHRGGPLSPTIKDRIEGVAVKKTLDLDVRRLWGNQENGQGRLLGGND